MNTTWSPPRRAHFRSSRTRARTLRASIFSHPPYYARGPNTIRRRPPFAPATARALLSQGQSWRPFAGRRPHGPLVSPILLRYRRALPPQAAAYDVRESMAQVYRTIALYNYSIIWTPQCIAVHSCRAVPAALIRSLVSSWLSLPPPECTTPPSFSYMYVSLYKCRPGC